MLEISGLHVTFGRRRNVIKAADDVSLRVAPEETLAIVGESGSGKTTVARCVVGLQRPDAGRVTFDGQTLGPAHRRTSTQRRAIQMVFQDPRSSLNPRMTVA